MNNPNRTPGRVPPLCPQALELVADILLRLAGRDAEYPAYTEEQLARRRLRPGAGCPPEWSRGGRASELLAAEMIELAKSAGLSADERTAWLMRLDGYGLEEIGEALGMSRFSVMRLLNRVNDRVEASPSRYRGLYASYISLTRRSGRGSPD